MSSAIGKHATALKVNVAKLGLHGDEQADLSIHGGLNKALYAYPIEHYHFWQERRRDLGVSLFEETLPHGFMGENLTLQGLLETEAWVGDELHFPNCVLRVTEPREPCGKFNAVMGYPSAGKDMAQTGCSGFYLAVEQAGTIAAGESFTLHPGRRALSISQAFAGKWAKHRR
jgi:MOSC domain-containing protein YiiM